LIASAQVRVPAGAPFSTSAPTTWTVPRRHRAKWFDPLGLVGAVAVRDALVVGYIVAIEVPARRPPTCGTAYVRRCGRGPVRALTAFAGGSSTANVLTMAGRAHLAHSQIPPDDHGRGRSDNP
jgi:hypothetical protein